MPKKLLKQIASKVIDLHTCGHDDATIVRVLALMIENSKRRNNRSTTPCQHA